MRTVSLEFATNLFGSIRPEIRQTLERVIAKPNQKTWEDAYCIILSGEGKMPTLWQAVRGIDPSFCCCKGMDEPWPEIPSSATIIKAIQSVTLKTNPN